MRYSQWLSVFVGCATIFMALVVVDELEPQPASISHQQKVYPPVSVLEVTPSSYQSTLRLLGLTMARWPLKIRSSTSAKLQWLDESIEPGRLVKKGQVLAKLDPSAINASIAQAFSHLKQAELELQRARHEQTVAVKMLNPLTSSPFARKEPQLLAAKAHLTHTKQAYLSAKKLLEETVITAPFNAVVTQRHISPGEWIEAGQVMFELAASDSMNVELPISDMHWQQVQGALTKPSIQVESRSGHQWSAKVRYISPEMDKQTRQREVVLSVEDPYQVPPRLYPNQQVEVVIRLGIQDNVVSVPLSAMTRDGYVWTLDNKDRLRKESVVLIEQGEHRLHVRFQQNSETARRVVRYPLLSMLPGQQVTPIEDIEVPLAQIDLGSGVQASSPPLTNETAKKGSSE